MKGGTNLNSLWLWLLVPSWKGDVVVGGGVPLTSPAGHTVFCMLVSECNNNTASLEGMVTWMLMPTMPTPEPAMWHAGLTV
jgi:hypothetical protein